MLFEIEHLTDADLLARVHELTHQDHLAAARLVAHLAEFDSRRLYVAEGFSSLFTYCIQVLHFSEYTAYRRIEAARVIRRFPVFLERIADGSVHLTAITLLAPHLTPENHLALLEAARHRTRRQIESILARLVPGAERPVRGYVVPLPPSGSITGYAVEREAGVRSGDFQNAGRGSENTGGGLFGATQESRSLADPSRGGGTGLDKAPEAMAESGSASEAGDSPGRADSEASTPPSGPPRNGAGIAGGAESDPLGTDSYRLHVTIGAATYRRLERARQLMSHSNPSGDLATVLDRALELLVEQLERRKWARTRPDRTTRKATPTPPPARTRPNGQTDRTLPASVRRAVWRRDHARCTFVGRAGNQCGSQFMLEYHHLVPWARGGESTVENLTLRCRAHNAYEAELSMGRRHRSTRTGASRDARGGSKRATSPITARRTDQRNRRRRRHPA